MIAVGHVLRVMLVIVLGDLIERIVGAVFDPGRE